MDVLIKGMEMPKEMECVEILLFSNGHCSFRKHERDEWVEAWAVALPEHGDLCDKNFLNTMIENADWSDKEALADYIIDLVYDAEVIVEGNDGTDN